LDHSHEGAALRHVAGVGSSWLKKCPRQSPGVVVKGGIESVREGYSRAT
jgi:hypothetical protein